MKVNRHRDNWVSLNCETKKKGVKWANLFKITFHLFFILIFILIILLTFFRGQIQAGIAGLCLSYIMSLSTIMISILSISSQLENQMVVVERMIEYTHLVLFIFCFSSVCFYCFFSSSIIFGLCEKFEDMKIRLPFSSFFSFVGRRGVVSFAISTFELAFKRKNRV